MVADPGLPFISHMNQGDLDSPFRKPDARAAPGTEGWLGLARPRHSLNPGCWWPTHHHHTIIQPCLSLALQLVTALLGHSARLLKGEGFVSVVFPPLLGIRSPQVQNVGGASALR